MNALSPIDYAIILGYLGLSVLMGLMMTRKAGASLENYFLGGHSLPWWLLGVAGMANWFDLTGTMIITSFLYMMGPRGLFVEFRGGAVLILAFLLSYTGKWHRRSKCMTGAEWMTYRFGEGRAAEGVRLLSAVVAVISTIMLLAYLIRGTSLFLGMFFPYPPMETTLALLTLTTLYTVSSGFYGVVLTDLIQGVIVMCSCVIVSIMAWHLVPSAASLGATAKLVTGNGDWIHSYPAWHTPMPPGYEAYEPLIMIASFYLLRNVLAGMGTGAEPRYFGAKSDRDCGLQSMLQGIMVAFRWPLMIGFAIMGIYLVHGAFPNENVSKQAAALVHQRYPDTREAFWNDLTSDIVHAPSHYPPELIAKLKTILGPGWTGKLPLVGYNGRINPEQILPAVLLDDMPVGFKGILVVAMFAAMMSCKNGMVNAASAYMVKDIYQNFLRPEARTRELITASYVSTIVIIALAFYFGVTAKSINDLWGWIIMGLGAGGLAPGMLRLYWWRCNAWGMFGGTFLGFAGAILQRIFIPQMPEWEQFTVMSALSFAGTIVGSLVTRPTPMDRLRFFYRTTRPFGLWGPLRDEFQGEERIAVEREHRNDIISVPFALLWQVTMFLLPMELVIKSYTAALCTLPLFLIGCVGLYFFWWKALPPAEADAVPESADGAPSVEPAPI
ncbi:MAG TPA: hypothetical protein VHY22_06210 [Chthoniobacteraceae bacterium]|jgi:Na+/proline symporter|nr:hypothetical protein [Chthoniobacteraceae bacterium]